MNNIAEQVLEAQQDKKKLNQLIQDYIPFIKKQLSGLQGIRLEYDDMLSLAMLTFSGCVEQYILEKGNFLAFCSVCIRNRLLDESRKQVRYESNLVPLNTDNGDQSLPSAAENASIQKYSEYQEQISLSEEIKLFSIEIKKFNIDFDDLPRICPKQVRSRKLCWSLAKEIVDSPIFYDDLHTRQRIPQNQLADRLQISPKTVEKHRKYIVTLAILMSGDYPHIQTFLPKPREVI